MTRHGWWAALACAAAIAGCNGPTADSDGGPTADAGTMGVDGGGDVCAGRTLCTTAGTSCDGDDLVTCAEDANGCMVETRSDCGASDQVCDASGGTAACVDPCAAIAEEDRCETADARACNDDVLEVCTMDTNGCLVLERMNCSDMPGGVCDDSGTMPMCAAPADPCADIPAAMRCDTEGTSCDGDDLVTCAANAFGCLVTTTTDCTSRAGGTCDDSDTATCTFTGDPCDGITQCTTAGTTCDGPELVTCAADAFGCMVETRTDCTSAAFGFCDADAAPAAMCSTGAVDPCMGETECGTSASRSCSDETTLSSCEPNAFGCFVSIDTDCSATSEVCSDDSGTAACVDPCSLIHTCPADTFCDGDDMVTCAADENGCLVESDRTTCSDTCDPMGAATCVDTACPEATPGFIDCSSGTITGDTASGTTVRDGYSGCSTFSYPGNEQIYRFRNSGSTPMEVQIVSTRMAASGDFDLFAYSAGDDASLACTETELTCLDKSNGTSETETVSFAANPGELAYVAYDIYNSSSATTEYTLEITCTPIVCGDGVVSLGEACDDGGTATGDGCSDVCALESGYGCSGEPSSCMLLCGNGTLDDGEACDDGGMAAADGCSPTCTVEDGYRCSGAGAGSCVAQAINASCANAVTIGDGVTTGDLLRGGSPPTGSSCGTSTGPVLYYSVTVGAHSRVEVSVEGTGSSSPNVVLRSLPDCDGDCSDAINEWSTLAEELTIVNDTDTPTAQLIAIGGADTSDDGQFEITVTTSALTANATCAHARSIAGTTTLTGEDLPEGGPSPSGDGCESGAGRYALYYSVTIPAGQSVSVEPDGHDDTDLVVFTQNACGDADCTFASDEPESAFLSNPGPGSITTIVGVRSYGTSADPVDVSFTYTSIGPNATCAGAIDLGSAPTTRTGDDARAGGPPIAATDCGSDSSPGPDLWYTVTVPANTVATFTVTPSASFDVAIRVADSCGASSCLDYQDGSGRGGAESVTLTNSDATGAKTYFVAVATFSGPGTFDIDVTHSSIPTNGVCTSATAVTTDTSLTGEDLAFGGPRPMGTNCRGGTGNMAMYYSVTLPPASTVQVDTDSSADLVVFTLDACSDTDCTYASDSPESATLTNGGTTDKTVIVGVRGWNSDTTGTFDISFAYTISTCGNATLEPGEQCDDGGTSDGDGCSASCTIEAADASFTASDTPIAIPDNDPTGATSTLTATSCTVAWARATVSITHTWVGDVHVTLVAPDGTRVTLTDGEGSSSDLDGAYTFASTGATWPGSGDPVPAGTYAADFSSLVGLNGAGTWSLEVSDDGNNDTGTLEGWSLELGCM